ncbi:MAG: hypothetical protein H7287_12495 [Thermoleophilia bacterium]|nr:hypothetical protein [Thermoleophilia bacterium]
MANEHNKPTLDSTAKEWHTYLRGKGHVPEDQPKPVSNYKAFHGFWVPPRLGSAGKPASKSKSVSRARVTTVDKRWYSDKMLVALFREQRRTFDGLRERFENIEALVKDQVDQERLSDQRTLLEPAVEAGLLNQAEADKKVAAWAKSQGIALPKR